MTFAELMLAFLMGLVIWGLGSIIDPAKSNKNARLAGLIVFVCAVLILMFGR